MLSGSKLQYIRRLRGLTQEYIAECIGVTERWVSKVECENSSISQETYDKWILALYGGLKPVKKKVSPKLDLEKPKVAVEKKSSKKK